MAKNDKHISYEVSSVEEIIKAIRTVMIFPETPSSDTATAQADRHRSHHVRAGWKDGRASWRVDGRAGRAAGGKAAGPTEGRESRLVGRRAGGSAGGRLGGREGGPTGGRLPRLLNVSCAFSRIITLTDPNNRKTWLTS